VVAAREKRGVEVRSPDAVTLELRRACGAEDEPSSLSHDVLSVFSPCSMRRSQLGLADYADWQLNELLQRL
jgi:hypothetical protein